MLCSSPQGAKGDPEKLQRAREEIKRQQKEGNKSCRV